MAIRKRLTQGVDRVFSRRMLGSVLVGLAITKTILYTMELFLDTLHGRIYAWAALTVGFIVLFSLWRRIEGELDN